MIQDIELVSNNQLTFDWNFNNNDIVTVIGNDRIKSAVKHAVLLKPQELELELYQDKGCEVHNYIKGLNNENIKNLITESIILACKEVNGVSDATVTLSQDNNEIVIANLTVTNNNGVEVVVI